MRVGHLLEPLLEFGDGPHVDVRGGLAQYGPLDKGLSSAPGQIRVGVVGTTRACEGLVSWLARIGEGVAAKKSRQSGLFPAFPGFGNGTALKARLALDSRLVRTIPQKIIDEAIKANSHNNSVLDIEAPFLEELKYLKETGAVDVVLFAVPEEAIPLMSRASEEAAYQGAEEPEPKIRLDLHDSLKASAMRFRKPTQLILPTTYGEELSRKISRQLKSSRLRVQDEATRAWNLYIALYYKAGGQPWRMERDATALAACYIGVSFYRSLDGSSVKTSLAQVFNQRGEGVVVRGGAAHVDKRDRQPHLNEEDARDLLRRALKIYRDEHHTSPARVVLHKSSRYTDEEKRGFVAAIRHFDIEYVDLVAIQRSYLRLFRNGNYPALRGTFFHPGENEIYLYTRGSVPFYETYPGMYLPRMLRIQLLEAQSSPLALAAEILALTKMNWNDSQFDGGEPITLRGSRKVGNILKYLESESEDDLEPRYSFYM